MLRVTTKTEEMGTVLLLEGRLAGPWVQELADCWQKAANSDPPLRVIVCDVTFIDDKGKALLAEIYRHGAELMAEGCMNMAIVEEITQGRRR